LSGGLAARIATRLFTGLLALMVIRTHSAAPHKTERSLSQVRHDALSAKIDRCGSRSDMERTRSALRFDRMNSVRSWISRSSLAGLSSCPRNDVKLARSRPTRRMLSWERRNEVRPLRGPGGAALRRAATPREMACRRVADGSHPGTAERRCRSWTANA